jgi:hypothetical protein
MANLLLDQCGFTLWTLTYYLLFFTCKPSCEWSRSLTSFGSLIYNNSIAPLPPYRYIILLLARYHTCPAWPPAFTLMLTLLALLKHDTRGSRLYKFWISSLFICVHHPTICAIWRPVSHFTPYHFLIGATFTPCSTPNLEDHPSAAVTNAYSLSLKLSSIYRSHFSATPWLAALPACVLLWYFSRRLPSLNMLTYSMLCTCATETAWSLKIWSTHTRSYQSWERNLHEFTDACHSAPNEHTPRHSVQV